MLHRELLKERSYTKTCLNCSAFPPTQLVVRFQKLRQMFACLDKILRFRKF